MSRSLRPSRSPTARRLPALATLAALAIAAALPAHATPRPLSDDELGAVRGADGSLLVGLQATTASSDTLVAGLAAAFSGSNGATLIDSARFAAELAPLGLAPSAMPGYVGQGVAETRVDAAPVSFTFDMSSVLQAIGVDYRSSGPSMGSFTVKDFDARGTTLWVWPHH